MARLELGALQEREFRLLFAATTVTRLGGAMAPIALAFGVLDLTGSVSDLGFVMAAGGCRSSRLSSSAVSGPTGSRGYEWWRSVAWLRPQARP
jgi:hypothetical protein